MVAMMNPNEPLTAHDVNLDSDPVETTEWCQALESTLARCGPARARFLLQRLQAHALELGLEREAQAFSAYRNTLPVEQQAAYPGDLELDERITGILRWNALAMVVRANHAYGELGGHIASYASAAEIFEVGFQHFSAVKAAASDARATWCSSSRTRRRAFMLVLFSKGGSLSSNWPTTGRKSPAMACVPTRTLG